MQPLMFKYFFDDIANTKLEVTHYSTFLITTPLDPRNDAIVIITAYIAIFSYR